LLPGTEAIPADVLIPHWTGGRDTALDHTVINPLQERLVRQAATTPGHSLIIGSYWALMMSHLCGNRKPSPDLRKKKIEMRLYLK
jgi:hypothetical protein